MRINFIITALSLIAIANVADAISCTNYRLGCNGLPCPYPTALFDLGVFITKYFGCTCENATSGPDAPCPGWLTCPSLPFGYLILLGYDLQLIFGNGTQPCHCECVSTECPAYTLPDPSGGCCAV